MQILSVDSSEACNGAQIRMSSRRQEDRTVNELSSDVEVELGGVTREGKTRNKYTSGSVGNSFDSTRVNGLRWLGRVLRTVEQRQ